MDVSSSGIGESAPAHALFNRFDTFVDLLRWRAGATPDRLALTFASSSEQAQSFTYAQLDLGARAIAATLQQHHCAGERAVILLQPGTHYILALLGCWYARVTAVPVFSPRENSSNERVRLILQDAGARAVLSTASVLSDLDRGEWRSGGKGEIAFVAIDQVAPQTAQNWRTPSLSSQTLAVLQYTSGSTGAPKGVRLQHRHLLKNSEMIHRAMDTREDDIGVFWLPPYHDMGLIGSILQPLYRGYPVHLMAPAAFLQRPLRWLEMISRLKGTVSAAPNFAYDLCTRRIKPEQRAQLDLSSWRLTVNGAEPVNKQTLDAFQEAFGPVGFRASAFSPSYGMAETTLLVASTPAHLPFRHLVADRRQLAQGRLVAGGSETIDVVSSGVVDRDASLCVVDPETLQPLADGFVGELWVAGPMVADGYWNNAEATRETFFVTLDGGEHHWLRTGDLGAIVDHQVYVTGRIKDLIIVAGHNHYPSDIESTVVASHSAVRANGVAAFAIDRHGEEALALVVELERGWSELDLNAVRDTLIAQVSRHHQLRVEQLTFVAINQVAKTSSGKIQRGRTREQLLRGELRPLSMETAQ